MKRREKKANKSSWLLLEIYNLSFYFFVFEYAARALNSIFQQWRISATNQWNTSGDVCSGAATGASPTIDDKGFNPFIKCDCTFLNGTTCRITALYVLSLPTLKFPFMTCKVTFLSGVINIWRFFSGFCVVLWEKEKELVNINIGDRRPICWNHCWNFLWAKLGS